jgi:hypothetical protein
MIYNQTPRRSPRECRTILHNKVQMHCYQKKKKLRHGVGLFTAFSMVLVAEDPGSRHVVRMR